jgi:hypothetical protein
MSGLVYFDRAALEHRRSNLEIFLPHRRLFVETVRPPRRRRTT